MLETEPFICTFQISTNAPLRICKIFMRNGKFVILTTLTVLVLNYRTIFQDRNCFLQTWDSSIRRYDHHPFVSAWTPRAFNDRARVIGEPAEVFWRHFANICAVRTACYFVRDPPPPRGSLVKPQHTRLQRNNFQRKVIRLFRGLAHARLLLALLSRSSTPLITNSRRLALSLGSFLRFCLFCSSFVLLSFSLSLCRGPRARLNDTRPIWECASATRNIECLSVLYPAYSLWDTRTRAERCYANRLLRRGNNTFYFGTRWIFFSFFYFFRESKLSRAGRGLCSTDPFHNRETRA